jgi:anti-sigma B factor antagonist
VDQNRIDVDRSDSGVFVVVLSGEHDVYTAPALRDQIDSVVRERAPFVIDLTPATFLDSSVLRVLLEARSRAEDDGLGFAVCLGEGEAPGVRRILEVTGLMPIFPVLPKRSAALDEARSAQRAK